MKSFSLALGAAALVAILAGCSGSNAGSQLPSPGAMQLASYHQSGSNIHADVPPDVGRSANWWAYYYCSGSSEICRYHVSYFPYYGGLVTTYLRPCATLTITCTWNSGRGKTYDSFLALIVTGNTALTGDLSGTTLSDTVNVTTSGPKTNFGDFQYGGQPYCSDGAKPSVRFFFISGGLFAYTHYWWSNPVGSYWTLAKDDSTTLSQVVNSPADWSDWNGQPGNYNSQTEARFANSIKHVRWVGLSFGGGCFFENGVNVSGPKRAIFNSTFTE
jgi:hypothetical protein